MIPLVFIVEVGRRAFWSTVDVSGMDTGECARSAHFNSSLFPDSQLFVEAQRPQPPLLYI
ncbi:hypothetical protein M378DRAFT_160200 [Amanita muscaria Koide BX008]|uniref:Uncharacterized protein n=1 Tax=Amanita muscaria (strain Koide BX008) TaxID=946122 RepID=A0A0C2XD07_AMAMK|nr:hypothetical protein M378DRAFT_160200 [Amanita muscaria Koide BX008]